MNFFNSIIVIFIFLNSNFKTGLSCNTTKEGRLVILSVYKIDIDILSVLARNQDPRKKVEIMGDLHYYLAHLDIAEKLNLSIEFKKVSSGWFGVQDKAGNWDGIVGDLKNCRGDITMGMGFTYSRSKVIEYAYPFSQSQVSFMTGRGVEDGARRFTPGKNPLTIVIGLWIICSVFVSVLSFAAIRKSFKVHGNLGFSDCMILTYDVVLFLIKSAFEQSSATNLRIPFAKHQLKAIISVWLLMLIVFSNLLKSQWVSEVLSPNYIHPPATFQELLKSDFKIYGGQYTTTTLKQEVQSLNTSVGIGLNKRAVDVGFKECIKNVQKPKTACFGYWDNMDIFAREMMTSANGEPLYQISNSAILPLWIGYALQPNSSIKGVVEFVALSLLEAGIYKTWDYEVRQVKSKKGRQLALKMLAAQNSSKTNEKLQFEMLKRAQRELGFLLFFGVIGIVGGSLLIGEIALYYFITWYRTKWDNEISRGVLVIKSDEAFLKLSYLP